MITTSKTARNIWLIVETFIMSHTGIAYHVEHNAQGMLPHHGFSLFVNIECACRALNLCVLHLVRCLESITKGPYEQIRYWYRLCMLLIHGVHSLKTSWLVQVLLLISVTISQCKRIGFTNSTISSSFTIVTQTRDSISATVFASTTLSTGNAVTRAGLQTAFHAKKQHFGLSCHSYKQKCHYFSASCQFTNDCSHLC